MRRLAIRFWGTTWRLTIPAPGKRQRAGPVGRVPPCVWRDLGGTADGQIFQCLLLRLSHPRVFPPGICPPWDTSGGGPHTFDSAGSVRADHHLLPWTIYAVIQDTGRSEVAGLNLYLKIATKPYPVIIAVGCGLLLPKRMERQCQYGLPNALSSIFDKICLHNLVG